MLKPAFAMKQTCSIKRWIERGISADVYDTAVEVKCRVNMGRNLAQNQSNYGSPEASTEGTIFFPSGTQIKPKDVIIFGGLEYRVVSARPRYDLNGAENHIEVTVGKA